MEEPTRHKLIWGWLRALLGIAQMSLVVSSAILLFSVGLRPFTYACVIAATMLTVISRILYRGRSDPNLDQGGRKL